MLEDVYTPLCTVLFGEHGLTPPSELLYLFLSWFFTMLISMGKTLCIQSAYRAASSSIKSARWPSQTRQLWHAQITTQLTPTTFEPLRETISHSFAHWSFCDFEVFEVWSLLLSERCTLLSNSKKKYWLLLHWLLSLYTVTGLNTNF